MCRRHAAQRALARLEASHALPPTLMAILAAGEIVEIASDVLEMVDGALLHSRAEVHVLRTQRHALLLVLAADVPTDNAAGVGKASNADDNGTRAHSSARAAREQLTSVDKALAVSIRAERRHEHERASLARMLDEKVDGLPARHGATWLRRRRARLEREADEELIQAAELIACDVNARRAQEAERERTEHQRRSASTLATTLASPTPVAMRMCS